MDITYRLCPFMSSYLPVDFMIFAVHVMIFAVHFMSASCKALHSIIAPSSAYQLPCVGKFLCLSIRCQG